MAGRFIAILHIAAIAVGSELAAILGGLYNNAAHTAFIAAALLIGNGGVTGIVHRVSRTYTTQAIRTVQIGLNFSMRRHLQFPRVTYRVAPRTAASSVVNLISPLPGSVVRLSV